MSELWTLARPVHEPQYPAGPSAIPGARRSVPFTVAPTGGTGNIMPLDIAVGAGKLGLSYYAGDSAKN